MPSSRHSSILILCGLLGAACCKNKAPAAAPAPAAKAQTVRERPQSKADCDAKGGVWGKRGLDNTEGCLWRMKDGGRACRDGADCEGECIADRKTFEVVEKGPPPRGYFKGHCSEYDVTFGCYRPIAKGARAKGPLTEDEAAEEICVD
jgi:hypothetical protein